MNKHWLNSTLALALLAAATVAQAQTKTLVLCQNTSIESFDTLRGLSVGTFNATSETLYDKLVEHDPVTDAVVPELAERWEFNADGTVLTMTLRKGVRFHSTDYFKPTREFNATDVVFSYQRLMNPDLPFAKAYGGRYPYARALTGPVATVEAVDPQTVRFTLTGPNATILKNMASAVGIIVSAEYAEQLLKDGRTGEFDTKPIGTGPFVLRRYEKDAQARFDANAAYWGPRPAFDRYVITIQPDSAVRLQKLKTGECHIGGTPKPTELDAYRADPNLTMH